MFDLPPQIRAWRNFTPLVDDKVKSTQSVLTQQQLPYPLLQLQQRPLLRIKPYLQSGVLRLGVGQRLLASLRIKRFQLRAFKIQEQFASTA